MTFNFSAGHESLDRESYLCTADKTICDSEEDPVDGLKAEKFFSFLINESEFLLPIAAVQEVIDLPSISFLPNANRFVAGVFPLRGIILPAVNMRRIAGSPRGEPSLTSRIIIVHEAGLSFGLIVDGINRVIAVSPAELEAQSDLSSSQQGNFCSCNLNFDGKIIGIIEPNKLLKRITGDADLDLS